MNSSTLILRPLRNDEWDAVAGLIFKSTNAWYRAHRGMDIFSGRAADCRLFPEVYEALDPGCCLVAEDPESGRLMGSCFYHPRETHVSLGIMNVSGEFFGRGVARALLDRIVDFARGEGKPLRLVSSAMNLDSFSLYTRAGFLPRALFQDMLLPVPEEGLDFEPPGLGRVREARPGDAERMADLEYELAGIRREKDFAYFIRNEAGIWHTSILEDEAGKVAGFLCSVNHPGSNMLGPGMMQSEEDALALIHAELNYHRGRAPVFLVPSDRALLVQTLYGWGARNCELHVAQVLGEAQPVRGAMMPTFMPETG